MRPEELGNVNVVETEGLLFLFLFLRELMIFHLCSSLHLFHFSLSVAPKSVCTCPQIMSQDQIWLTSLFQDPP